MADNTINIKIVADNSQVNSASAETAAKIEGLGDSVEEQAEKFVESSGRIEKFGGGLVHISTHIASEVIPGFSRMALRLAGMAEEAVGVAAVLEVMIPLAILAAGYEIMEKLEKAALKDAEATAELAHENAKLSDEILGVNERITGLVKGPMAEAIEKAKDLGEKENKLGEIFKTTEKALDLHVTKWATFIQTMQHATDVVVAFSAQGFGLNRSVPLELPKISMGNDELMAHLALIQANVQENKKYAEALKELQGIMVELGEIGGPKSLEQMAAVEDTIRKVSTANALFKKEQEEADIVASQKKAKNAIDETNTFKDETERLKNEWAIRISDAETANKLLSEADKIKITEAEAPSTKTRETVENELKIKLAANEEEARSAHNLSVLKETEARELALKEIDIAEKEAEQKKRALAGDPEEERVKKTRQISEETAAKVLTIETKKDADLDKLRNEDLVKQQGFEAQKAVITEAGVKQRMEIAAKEFRQDAEERDRSLSLYEEGLRKQLQLQEDAAKEAQKQREIMGSKTTFESSGSQTSLYTKAIADLDKLVQKQQIWESELEKTKELELSKGDKANVALVDETDSEIEKTKSDLQKLIELREEYAAKIQAIDDAVVAHNRQAVEKMTQVFNSNIQQWITHAETFGQAMARTWNSILLSVIQSILKQMEMEAIQFVFRNLQLTTHMAKVVATNTAETASTVVAQAAQTTAVGVAQAKQTASVEVAQAAQTAAIVEAAAVQKAAGAAGSGGDKDDANKDTHSIFNDAAAAAAKVFHQVIDKVPFPANVILAPLAAAGVFAAVTAYKGFIGSAAEGHVSGESSIPLLVHSGEVLTHMGTLGSLGSPSASFTGGEHARVVGRDQVVMTQPGMVVVPKAQASGLLTSIQARGGNIGLSTGAIPPSGIRELPQKLPTDVSSAISRLSTMNLAVARDGFMQGGVSLLSAEAGFVSGGVEFGMPVPNVSSDKLVTSNTSTSHTTVNHIRPEVHITHAGTNLGEEDIVAAVQKGIRNGWLRAS